MDGESIRIADQLRRAFAGQPWHGSPLRELLAGVTAVEAMARPLEHAHTIRELVAHIELWVDIAFEATRGIAMPELFTIEKRSEGRWIANDWVDVSDAGETSWGAARERLFESAERLALAIEEFEDGRLTEIVPGRQYDFYYLFHGIVQHSLYHAGQIAILSKATIKR